MDKTKIQWADSTWNWAIGCDRVSAGCDNCYAFTQHDRRYKGFLDGWDAAPKQYHVPFSAKYHGQGVQILADRLDAPRRWAKPRRIFVNSLSDVFHESIPLAILERVWRVMAETPQHTYQILTKRPEVMEPTVATLAARFGVLPNVHLLVSVEDQATADQRVPYLLRTRGAVRGISLEPMLEAVDLSMIPCPWGPHGREGRKKGYCARCCHDYNGSRFGTVNALEDGVDWVIVGGESGARARPLDLAWVRSIIAQGREAGAAVFVKQLGQVWAKAHHHGHDGAQNFPIDTHAGDPDYWPADLRVREWPHVPPAAVAAQGAAHA